MTKSALFRVEASRLEGFAKDLLVAFGVRADIAADTARGLCFASLRGTDSHGIRLLPHYLDAVRSGRINPDPDFRFQQTGPATGLFDADHAYGQPAGLAAVRKAIEMADEAGVGMVAVKNSSHCGAMAFYGVEPCDHDMIGLALTHASPKVLSPSSTGSFFGINPICLCAPMADEAPFTYDSAPTVITSNRVKMHREQGAPLPEGVAADAAGVATTDPRQAEQLVPIGDYKGFGLAMVVDVFCALLTGMPAGPDVSMMYADPLSEKRYLGQFYGAIRIDRFESPNLFKERLSDICRRIREQPMRPGAKVPPMAPGDPEKACARQRSASGIPLDETLVERLQGYAKQAGLPEANL